MCKCKELINKGRCDDGSSGILVYPNVNIGEYLDYANCIARKRLNDKLVKECDKDIDGNEIIYNATLNDY